ncbi:transcription factor domain-containing protein [Aspergillus clavatus NRRL 1]|uniref:C6 transcription factor, putative n=1 Tax=Aspergillus clavatus (strain ATCC 1007 / CBS 513.65 / DSM 816 / NCTC 3887 / NRRL 1 / QM 1276 / 107) TaxID=344612 RepID=A1CCM7_ASPCL|nr:C6 transcription factor, putative [Aspergillus clavatus NRRL 1]EAW12284.1 C6 transcription factor, putative [Aspergillus clavatus NRRL 1]
MYSVPRRTRTAESGACSNCVKSRQRCYIGVSGGPCSSCRRAKLDCDAHGSKPPRARSVNAGRPSALTYCPGTGTPEEIFASQLRESEREYCLKNGMAGNPAVLSTIPLDYHISIINQLLGIGAPPAVHLPNYLASLPDRLHRDDIEYLRRGGAFDLPSDRLRNELLTSYLLWVHPHMPIVALHGVLSAIADANSSYQISLLLFHAVMFAASAFVDVSHIRAEGFPSRSALRESLFRKVKVLLDLECEDDRLAVARSLLLIVSWPEPHRDQKELTHWLGMCISLVKSAGLHQMSTASKHNSRQQRLWKRAWWSIHNHVRLSSSSLLPLLTTQNASANFSIPQPCMEDFEFGAISPSVQALVGHYDFLRDIQYQQFHARAFIERTALCQLEQVSGLLEGTSAPPRRADVSDDAAASQASFLADGEFACKLRSWHTQLPPALHYRSPSSSSPTDLERFILVHRAWLLLLYLASAYVVCSRKKRASSSPGNEHILDRIGLVFEDLDKFNLTGLLPAASIAILLPVLEFHLHAVRSAPHQSNPSSQQKLHRYLTMLHQFRENSALAEQMIGKISEATSSRSAPDAVGTESMERNAVSGSQCDIAPSGFGFGENDDFYTFLEAGLSFARVFPSVDGLDPELNSDLYVRQ